MDIKELLMMTEKEIYKYAKNTLKQYYSSVIATKDYIFATGEQPICLVAHLDTVLKHPTSKVYHDKEENVLFGAYGLGADDRAGVAAIVQMLEKGYKPSVIFTVKEEDGGSSAWKLVEDYPNCPFNINYLCEIDRGGRNNFVTYDCFNTEFDEYITKFGWEKQEGTFSDIAILGPAWGIASANVGCGYINEHSLGERLHLDWLNETIDRVEKMIADSVSTRRYSYIPAAISSGTANFYGCAICEKLQSMENIFYVRFGKKEANTYIPMCKDCLIELNIQYCPQCKELHWAENDKKLCEDCEEALNGAN